MSRDKHQKKIKRSISERKKVYCDLCGMEGCVHVYCTTNYVNPSDNEVMPGIYEDGWWIACEVCKTLIDQKRYDALRTRAIASHYLQHMLPPGSDPEGEEHIDMMHDFFRNNQKPGGFPFRKEEQEECE